MKDLKVAFIPHVRLVSILDMGERQALKGLKTVTGATDVQYHKTTCNCSGTEMPNDTAYHVVLTNPTKSCTDIHHELASGTASKSIWIVEEAVCVQEEERAMYAKESAYGKH